MSFSDRIKSFFRIKKLNKINEQRAETRLVGYDTSLVFVPLYKELSEDAKKIVENYKKEISNIQETEKLIYYATELIEAGNQKRDILINLLYNSSAMSQISQVENLSIKELVQKRFEIFVMLEEMKHAQAEVLNLKQEAILRAVAVEEIIKEQDKLKRRFFSIFQKAEQMKRKMELQMLENTRERMKITIKTLEQESQALEIAMNNDNTFVEKFSIYQKALESLEQKEYEKLLLARKEIIQSNLELLLKICETILPEEKERILKLKEENINLDEQFEKNIISEIADIKRKIDIYAMQNKEKITELQEMLEIIKKEFLILQEENAIDKGKNPEADKKKKELQDILAKLEIGYQIFKNYLKDEDWQNFYEIEFDLLAFRMESNEYWNFKKYRNINLTRFYPVVEKKLQKLFTKESREPKLYAEFVEKLRRHLRLTNSENNVILGCFDDPEILQFLVDIENPKLGSKLYGSVLPKISIVRYG